MSGYRQADANPSDLIGEFGESRRHKVYFGAVNASECYAPREEELNDPPRRGPYIGT